MPWKPSDATRHTKAASTDAKKRKWAHVANHSLAEGSSEGEAIRKANSAVRKKRRKQ